MKRIVKLLGMFLVWNFSFSPSFGDDLVTILSLALENDPTLRQAKASYLANHETVASEQVFTPAFLWPDRQNHQVDLGPNRFYLR